MAVSVPPGGILACMTDATDSKPGEGEKVLFEKGAGNGHVSGRVRVSRVPRPEPEPCEDCPPEGSPPGKAQFGLGLLITAVAGALAYIGLDLLTGGRVSGRGRPWPEEEE